MVGKLEVALKGSPLNREYLLGIRMPQALLIYGRIHHFSWDNWDNSLFLWAMASKPSPWSQPFPRDPGKITNHAMWILRTTWGDVTSSCICHQLLMAEPKIWAYSESDQKGPFGSSSKSGPFQIPIQFQGRYWYQPDHILPDIFHINDVISIWTSIYFAPTSLMGCCCDDQHKIWLDGNGGKNFLQNQTIYE